MAAEGVVRVASTRTAEQRLADLASWYVRDPATGDVVLGEKPNRRLKAVYALRAARWLLHRCGLTKGAPADRVLANASDVVMLVWAVDEAVRGRSPLRRTLGALAVLWAVRSLRSRT